MPIARPLYDLQLIDTHLARVRRDRLHLDDGEKLRADVATLQKALAAQEAVLNRLSHARTDKEEELQQREEKLRTQQTRLMNAKSAHEVTSLQRDIESITKSRGELDEAILTVMEEIDACAAKLDELRTALQNTGNTLSEVENKFAEDAHRLDVEMKEVLVQREAAAPLLNEEETEHYETSAKKHGGIAVTWNEKGNCAACGMTLTPYNMKEARTQEWPQCESCGRLLFIEVS